MARADGNRALEDLYRALIERQFDFMPRGAHRLQDVYAFVSERHPELCDDSYLCSASCKHGYNSPEWQHVVRAVLKNVRDRGGPVARGSSHGWWVFGSQASTEELPTVSAVEGRVLLRLHKVKERKPALVEAKKRGVLAATGRLACEACDFDFAAEYGELGCGFAECHHTQPLAETAGERPTTLADLAVVCANCHRMLHKRPWHTVEALRELVRSRRGGKQADIRCSDRDGM
jgi:hypothetical protein